MRVDLGMEGEIKEGGMRCATAERMAYALFKVNGQVFCLDNTCTHAAGPLCRGTLDGFSVRCPLHGSKFDVRSGEVVGPPARSPVRSYAVTVEGGRVFAEVP